MLIDQKHLKVNGFLPYLFKNVVKPYFTRSVPGNFKAKALGFTVAATAGLTRRSVVQVRDVVEVRVIGSDGNVESQTHSFKVPLRT